LVLSLAYRMKTNLPKNPLRSTLLLFFCLLIALPAVHSQTAPREVHVAAAEDLQPVLPALTEAFMHATGIKLIAQYGTTASLTSQLLAGDSADLFLATDCVLPEQIIARGLADSPEPIPFARGVLVLWARTDSPLQPLTQNTLRDPRVQSLAIANPELISYGMAAVATLRRMKLYDQLKPDFIVAEDLAQTAEFVESGKAQLGFISLIAASTPHRKQIGSFILMPPIAYGDIRQCAVVLSKSTHRDDAHAFLDWLRSAPIQQALPTYGLNPIQQIPVPHP
jgi:molybdate transport system substrate-binding protein